MQLPKLTGFFVAIMQHYLKRFKANYGRKGKNNAAFLTLARIMH